MDNEPVNGPEVRTRCLIKFHNSHPQVVWARSEKRGTSGRVVDFTEDGRSRNQLRSRIVIWKRKDS